MKRRKSESHCIATDVFQSVHVNFTISICECKREGTDLMTCNRLQSE